MHRRRLAVTILAAALAAAVPSASGVALAADRPDDSRATLAGSVPDWVVSQPAASDRPSVTAAAPDSLPLRLTVQVPMRHAALADRWVEQGRVISPREYRETFAASAARLERATGWARRHGLVVTGTDRDSGSVDVRGSVEQVEAALHTRISHATADGQAGVVPTTVPSVDASAGINGVSGLDTLALAHTHDRVNPWSRSSTLSGRATAAPRSATGGVVGAHGAVSDGSAACAHWWGQHHYPTVRRYQSQSNHLCGYRPAQLGDAYGAGAEAIERPRIAIVLWGNDARLLKRTNTYMRAASYPVLPSTHYRAHVAARNPTMEQCDPQGAKAEQALDVQAAHAIAPRARIDYYGAASCSFRDMARAVQRAVSAGRASVISMSFGSTSDAALPDADVEAMDRAFTQAALTGISVFASTGDWGNNSTMNPDGRRGVGFPASSRLVTAVGGTSMGIARDRSRVLTTGWEDRFFAQERRGLRSWREWLPFPQTSGAGGGHSDRYRKPHWQRGRVDGSSAHRMVPDVSAVADPFTGFRVRYTAHSGTARYASFGGTSLAAPVVAGLVAVSKARTGREVGLAAPSLYRLMGTPAIRDVRHHSAGVFVPGAPRGYAFTVVGFDTRPENLRSNPAWDTVTGVGEPRGEAFLTDFGR
ncbi:MAG TPA: S53 family peptidase [Segeticoccus sp.]|nr:S53 family peptidase [Segeticoccus sp.]